MFDLNLGKLSLKRFKLALQSTVKAQHSSFKQCLLFLQWFSMLRTKSQRYFALGGADTKYNRK